MAKQQIYIFEASRKDEGLNGTVLKLKHLLIHYDGRLPSVA
jgi:hypothetical protein